MFKNPHRHSRKVAHSARIISVIRNAMNLSSADLSALIGCSQPYLTNIENGVEKASASLMNRFYEFLAKHRPEFDPKDVENVVDSCLQELFLGSADAAQLLYDCPGVAWRHACLGVISKRVSEGRDPLTGGFTFGTLRHTP